MHENDEGAADKRARHTAALDHTMARLLDRCDGLDDCSDAVSQILVAVIGSGPAVAVLDGMMAANQANALMYHQAVANQQRTNLLGMSVMTRCVKLLLDDTSEADLIDAEILANSVNR